MGLNFISKVMSDMPDKGKLNSAFHYILKKNYYETYSTILGNSSVTVIPETADGNSSNLDTLAAVSMMMHGNTAGGISSGSRAPRAALGGQQVTRLSDRSHIVDDEARYKLNDHQSSSN